MKNIVNNIEFAEIENHWAKAYILDLTERGIIQRQNDGLFHPDDKLTTKDFVRWVIRSSKGKIEPSRDGCSSGYMDYALHKGIIEDYDMTNINNPIERRSAARIVHEVLLTEFGERDEDEWSAAKNLKDLYSCRTCVMHIAQVYVKGIMLKNENKVFDLKGKLTRAEASAVVVRMLDRGQRIPQKELRAFKIKNLHPDEARELILNDSKVIIIDVRTNEEYKTGHIKGSICTPLGDISNNPYTVSANKDTPIILYCQKGYKSSIAAQVLVNAGYREVYTIPGIEQYRYKLTQ
ncbi:rhodanese-like domain-containing protein [Natronospora cellulosivora (SeqCode)]